MSEKFTKLNELLNKDVTFQEYFEQEKQSSRYPYKFAQDYMRANGLANTRSQSND